MRHTPTPWVASGRTVICGNDGGRVGEITDPYLSKEDNLANREFIIRTVNNHDALVRLIARLRGDLEYIHLTVGNAYAKDCGDELDLISIRAVKALETINEVTK